jgi:GTP-binding protein HflX
VIPVFNKCDLLPAANIIPFMGNSVRISAATGAGTEKLLSAIEENLPVKSKRVKMLLPFSQSGLAAQIRREGTVENEEYTDLGLVLTAQVPSTLDGSIGKYIIE